MRIPACLQMSLIAFGTLAFRGPALAAETPAGTARERCAALARASTPTMSVTSTLEEASPHGRPEWKLPPIPARCRVQVTLRPTADSDIKAEVWLPVADWNGRFLGLGVGGFGGVIVTPELELAVQRGYATGTTDAGHGTEGTEVWARGHPEKVVDYGHRAIHLMTVVAKEMVTRFYGQPANHHYFAGCSNGGRQGLMEALRYPDDYDGILSGAPAADFTGLIVGAFGTLDEIQRTTPFPSRKLPLLERASLGQCDALDGAVDGLIGAPHLCRFDPARMKCGASRDENACFTTTEVDALQRILRGPTAKDGTVLYPGFSEGGEAPDPPSPGWEGWIVAKPNEPTVSFNLHSGFMRDFLTGDPDWKSSNFVLERDLAAARTRLGPIVDAHDPDLTAFVARGGKLILWHGWSDQAIPAQATLRYHEALVDRLGEERVEQFSRLYMVPGMQHCFLGPGAWAFNGAAGAKPGADPATDMAASLEAWVERGVAPGPVIALRPKNPYSMLAGYPPLEIDRTALLCPHPSKAKYKGQGSPREASSYSCTMER